MVNYSGKLIIKNCYSTGNIQGKYAGGIAGYNTSNTNDSNLPSISLISNCYSRGQISGEVAGGIYGYKAAQTTGSIADASNCYSSGLISGAKAGGIFDTSYNYTGQKTTKCYVANGNWLDINANTSLNMTVNAWIDISSSSNTVPYLLADFSYNMYSPNAGTNITTTSASSLPLGYTYSITSVNNAPKPSTMTINANNGVITIQPDNISNGTYNIKVLAQKSGLNNYYFSNFTYIDSPVVPCFLEGTKILCLKNNEEQYIKIEDLEKGDLIKTYKQGYLPLGVMGYTCIHNKEINNVLTENLYKCSKEKYPQLVEDLYLTGGHGILMSETEFNSQLLSSFQVIQSAINDIKCCVNSNILYLHFTEFIKSQQQRKIDDLYCVNAYKDIKAERFNKDDNYNIWNLALDSNDDDKGYGIYANGLLVEAASKNFMKNDSDMILKYI